MEDFILREIDKIGKLLQAILLKVGVGKKTDEDGTLYESTKIQLLNELNLNLDTLLENDNFIHTLITEYKFSNGNLETFAELLYDFVVTAQDKNERIQLITRISAIYKYLEASNSSISINRFYILKELDKYTT